MKIHTDQVNVPEKEQQKAGRKTEGSVAFSDVLAQQQSVQGTSTTGQSAALPPLGAMNPLLGMQQMQQVQQTGQVEQVSATTSSATEQAMNNVEELLSEWENYAGKLEQPGQETDLKQAYAVLEKIGAEVDRMKQDMPDMAQENPGLSSLVNELEILSVTETIKFNRGDYI